MGTSLRVADVYGKLSALQDCSIELGKLKNGKVTELESYKNLIEKISKEGRFCLKLAAQNKFLETCHNTDFFSSLRSKLQRIIVNHSLGSNKIVLQQQLTSLKNELYEFTRSFSLGMKQRLDDKNHLVFFTEVKLPPKPTLQISKKLDWQEKLRQLKANMNIDTQEKEVTRNVTFIHGDKSDQEFTEEDSAILKEIVKNSASSRAKTLGILQKFLKRRKKLYGFTRGDILFRSFELTSKNLDLLKSKHEVIPFIEKYMVVERVKFVWILNKFARKSKYQPLQLIDQILYERNLGKNINYVRAGEIKPYGLYLFCPVLKAKWVKNNLSLAGWNFNLE